MTKQSSLLRHLTIVLLAGAVELTGVLAISGYFATPAEAQFSRERRAPSGGFFDQLFGGSRNVPNSQINSGLPLEATQSSRAPAPRKSETTPTLTVTVFGDSMADWLAYGLEQAFEDSPEIGIVRKAKTGSGLLRYEARSDLDWWHVARDMLAQEKTDYVVMMLGVNDRQDIRESQIQRDAEKAAKEKKEKEAAGGGQSDAAEPKSDDDDDDQVIAVPERKAPVARGVVEFRSERWEAVYGKRIDDTIASLKSRGVPVLWVGLPPIRGTRSTANAQYLNDLFRARAEKAGIAFVDVWDGFVDEGGKFTSRGPDFEGQVRLLRAGDGAHFTKAGARKLAHYVERDLRRFMTNRALPVALPSGGGVVPDAVKGPAERPLAGPVVPLTVSPGAEQLLGGGATRPVHSDPVATQVLVKGESIAPPRGRADDFAWPRQGAGAEPLSPTAAAARATTPPAAPPASRAAPVAAPPAATARAPAAASPDVSSVPTNQPPQSLPQRQTTGPAQAAPPARPETRAAAQQSQGAPRPPSAIQQRPPAQQQRRNDGLFGLFR